MAYEAQFHLYITKQPNNKHTAQLSVFLKLVYDREFILNQKLEVFNEEINQDVPSLQSPTLLHLVKNPSKNKFGQQYLYALLSRIMQF